MHGHMQGYIQGYILMLLELSFFLGINFNERRYITL